MSALIWLASRRDLGWRRRRFVIAVAAITLVLALTLLLSGFRDGIDVETARTVRALGGDAFVVREGVSGPFTTVSQLDEGVAATVVAGATRDPAAGSGAAARGSKLGGRGIRFAAAAKAAGSLISASCAW